jgi:hypothetical protein
MAPVAILSRGPPGASVAPAIADSYDHAVRAVIRGTGVAVTGLFHCFVPVWVNESSLRTCPLRRLIAGVEVVA